MKLRLLAIARNVAPDACLIGGLGALIYGSHLIYTPAAWILGGLVAIAAGVYLTRLEGKGTE